MSDLEKPPLHRREGLDADITRSRQVHHFVETLDGIKKERTKAEEIGGPDALQSELPKGIAGYVFPDGTTRVDGALMAKLLEDKVSLRGLTSVAEKLLAGVEVKPEDVMPLQLAPIPIKRDRFRVRGGGDDGIGLGGSPGYSGGPSSFDMRK